MTGASWTARRLLLATVCAVAVAGIYAAQPLVRAAGADLGLPPGATGWLVAAGQIGYLVGLLILVPLGDLTDRRRLVAAHLALGAVGTAAVAVAPTPALVLVGLGVAGLFAVVVQIAVAYAAAVAPPAERGRTIGVVTSGVVLGILGARTVAGYLSGVAGWRGVYVLLAAASLLLALVVLAALPPDPRPTGGAARYRESLVAMGRLVRGDRVFRGRALITLLLFASFGTLWSGVALPLGAAPWHLSPARIGLLGLAGLAGALAAAHAGRWADRGRADTVTGWSLLLLIVSWAASALLGRSLWPLVVGVVLLDFAVQAVHVSSQHLITARHPAHASRTIGAYMVFYSVGSALGAVTTTAAYGVAGWPGSALLGAGYAGAALVAWLVPRGALDAVRRNGSADPAAASEPCPDRT
ncbi:MFS transporter [Actinocatenispora rupis]|uniref:MFS transporter n=1 Tax=Actinocatenispora rupis TaxID=519421 RepID=A0A8J3JCG4_9ACTN|nr:MFS transporter [Actinocatenispora rupis]GID12288.1 MFS transporter [Actinocatenispora rupis]